MPQAAIEQETLMRPSDLVRQHLREKAATEARERGEEPPVEEQSPLQETLDEASSRAFPGLVITFFNT
jgi:hypothetical protein